MIVIVSLSYGSLIVYHISHRVIFVLRDFLAFPMFFFRQHL
jgi:hypothetical protein